jgi:hypothetical protein
VLQLLHGRLDGLAQLGVAVERVKVGAGHLRGSTAPGAAAGVRRWVQRHGVRRACHPPRTRARALVAARYAHLWVLLWQQADKSPGGRGVALSLRWRAVGACG